MDIALLMGNYDAGQSWIFIIADETADYMDKGALTLLRPQFKDNRTFIGTHHLLSIMHYLVKHTYDHTISIFANASENEYQSIPADEIFKLSVFNLTHLIAKMSLESFQLG